MISHTFESQSITLAAVEKNTQNKPHTKKKDFGLYFLFFIVIYVILLVKVVSGHSIDNHPFFGFYSLVITIYIFSRFVFAYFHKSLPYDDSYEPTISFVVPAKNEGDNIAQTLQRFVEVNYPKEKIEVITINDGSTDNTVDEMYRMQRELGKDLVRFEVVDWKENKGKREGMAEGVKRATGDIIIFIDSDSFIEPDCVKHLVKYFSNKEVGAVSGHTDVYNRDTNLLTQMQAVRYYIAFKIYKAAESVFGVVTCCPGCCSAYRRSYLNEFIEDWRNQKFMGKQCTFGDDRSLTNFMIRNYKAAYSPEAKAYTVVPDNFGKYMKQQQRWKKSWVRETFIASSFIWKKNFLAAIFFYAYVFLAFASPIVFLRALVWRPYFDHTLPTIYLLGLFLMLLLHGLYYRAEVGAKSWFLAIVSFWFNTVILMWQLPWAILTMSDTRWGTR
jgi:hyaluronan synthase